VLIRCEGCGERLFAYYVDPDRQSPGDEPPEREDAFVVRRVERDLLKQCKPPARALYEYLRGFCRKHGYAPSLRQMQIGMGWESVNAVDHYLRQLEAAGLIERDTGVSRGIRLVHVA
jgi:hypothetical protein